MADTSEAKTSQVSQEAPPGTEQQVAGSGEAPSDDQVEGDWCKIFCPKNDTTGQEYYFSHIPGLKQSIWTEPDVPYRLWDFATGDYHISGLQQPTPKETLEKEQAIRDDEAGPLPYDDKDPLNGWQGYNPRVHGSYDKNAPYAAYHNWLAYQKTMEENPQAAAAAQQAQSMAYQNYDSMAQFNAQTGRYQTGDQTADRHDAASRAGRQMNAFFDVDSAANSHDGRSLKEERRNRKLTAKEIKEMNQKRKDKKHEKRLAFLKS